MMPQSPNPSGSSGILPIDQASSAFQILVVDDDALFLELFSRQLDVFGHQATTVPCAREALTELQANRFHLMITDWRMHDIDGCQLVREVRRLGLKLPIIICSGWLDQERLPDDVASELAGTLPKPARVDDMMHVINGAM
jgi:two-component system, NtrC family, response regulator AtoC